MGFPASDAQRRSDGVARLMDFGEYSHASAAESRSLSPLSATPSPTDRAHTHRQLLVETSPGDAWQVWTPQYRACVGYTVEYRLVMPGQCHGLRGGPVDTATTDNGHATLLFSGL